MLYLILAGINSTHLGFLYLITFIFLAFYSFVFFLPFEVIYIFLGNILAWLYFLSPSALPAPFLLLLLLITPTTHITNRDNSSKTSVSYLRLLSFFLSLWLFSFFLYIKPPFSLVDELFLPHTCFRFFFVWDGHFGSLFLFSFCLLKERK